MDLSSRFLQERRAPPHKVCVVLNKRVVTGFKSPCPFPPVPVIDLLGIYSKLKAPF